MSSDESSNDELPALLLSLAHDLRNPLAAVITNLEFVRRIIDREDNLDLWEAVTDSVAASDVLRRMINNLDIIAKANEIASTIHEVMLVRTVDEVLTSFAGRANQAGVAIRANELASEPRAMLDRSLYALALENLISNAVQHAPRGSTIDVESIRRGNQFTVCITDDGPTIPKALRSMAVDAAGQTRDGRHRLSRYGRGLSLLAAQRAASATSATLEIGSAGARSTLTLGVRTVDSVTVA